MSLDIKESDWKIFRGLREIALQRYCKRVLDDVAEIITESEKTSHERYLKLFQLLEEKDDALAHAFHNPRRSTAFHQLALIHSRNLLTSEEFSRFSPELRERAGSYLRMVGA